MFASGTLAPISVYVPSLAVSISSVVITVVQSITLESSSEVSRACGPGVLLEGVDEIFLIVKIKASDAPSRAFTLDGHSTFFRRVSRDGDIEILCFPPLEDCSRGIVQPKDRMCACVSSKKGSFTVALKHVASREFEDCVIDFVWRGKYNKSILSDEWYTVPTVLSRCTEKLSLFYISQRNWYAIIIGMAVAANLFVSLLVFAAICYLWRKDVGGVRSAFTNLVAIVIPSLKPASADQGGGGGGGGGSSSWGSSGPGGGATSVSAASDANSGRASGGSGSSGGTGTGTPAGTGTVVSGPGAGGGAKSTSVAPSDD